MGAQVQTRGPAMPAHALARPPARFPRAPRSLAFVCLRVAPIILGDLSYAQVIGEGVRLEVRRGVSARAGWGLVGGISSVT